MLHLVLMVALSGSEVEIPRVNPIDLKAFEAIRQLAEQYHEEAKRRKKMAGQSGCPFEPGTYWNLECA